MSDSTECRLVPRPDDAEEGRREEARKKLFGECYDCKHHEELCRICSKTGMPLTYPISGCCGHDPKWSTGVP